MIETLAAAVDAPVGPAPDLRAWKALGPLSAAWSAAFPERAPLVHVLMARWASSSETDRLAEVIARVRAWSDAG